MIYPVSLRFENAFSYRQCKIPLKNQGIVFIKGENLDIITDSKNGNSASFASNGAGKSSPPEVLEHILFSTTSKGLKKNSILTLLPDADGYFGQFIFDKTINEDTERFMIRQFRNHSKLGTGLKIFKEDKENGDWFDLTPKNANDAQAFISKELLELTVDEWHGCVYLSQGMSHILIEGTGGERQNYLSSLFQLNRYDKLLKLISEKAEILQEKLVDSSILESKLSMLKEKLENLPKLEDIQDEISYLKEINLIAKARQEQFNNIIFDLQNKINKATSWNNLRKRLDSLGYTEEQYEIIQDNKKEFIEDNNRCKKELRLSENFIKIFNQKDKIDRDIQELGDFDKTVKIRDLDVKLAEFSKILISLNLKKENIKKRISLENYLESDDSLKNLNLEELEKEDLELRTNLSKIYGELTVKKKKLNDMLKVQNLDVSVCPTCLQPISKDIYKDLIDDLKKDIEEQDKEFKELEQKQVSISTNLKKAIKYKDIIKEINNLPTDSLDSINEEIEKVSKENKECSELKNKLFQFNYLNENLSLLRLPSENKEYYVERVDELTKTISSNENYINKINEALLIMDQMKETYVDDSLFILEENLKNEEKQSKDIIKAYNEIHDKYITMKNQMNLVAEYMEDSKNIQEELNKINTVKEKYNIYMALKKAIPLLKKRYLHSIVQSIQMILPKYIDIMFNERNLKFIVDESIDSLDILAKRINTDTKESIVLPIKALSGGEKKRLSISLLFTLHDLLSTTKLIDLLILDEVDGGLDDDGLENLMNLISSKKENYGTIIMISHRQSISSSMFDKIWIARKKNQESTFITGNEEV